MRKSIQTGGIMKIFNKYLIRLSLIGALIFAPYSLTAAPTTSNLDTSALKDQKLTKKQEKALQQINKLGGQVEKVFMSETTLGSQAGEKAKNKAVQQATKDYLNAHPGLTKNDLKDPKNAGDFTNYKEAAKTQAALNILTTGTLPLQKKQDALQAKVKTLTSQIQAIADKNNLTVASKVNFDIITDSSNYNKKGKFVMPAGKSLIQLQVAPKGASSTASAATK